MLSSALEELVVDSEEDKQILGNGEGVKKKIVELASDISASGNEFKLGQKAEQEQDITEAVLVFEQTQIDEKTSLDDKNQEITLMEVALLASMKREVRFD